MLPDLYAEDPLLLSVRIPDGQTAGGLVLGGYSRLGHHERKVTLTSSARPDSGIATRWARARVGSLMDSLHEGADPELVRQDVVDVALEFNLVTRFTSLVAVDQSPAANRVTRLAANLPKGGAGSRLRLLAALIFTAIGLAVLAAGLTRAAERSQPCRWF